MDIDGKDLVSDARSIPSGTAKMKSPVVSLNHDHLSSLPAELLFNITCLVVQYAKYLRALLLVSR
jgi:hypothetical protein